MSVLKMQIKTNPNIFFILTVLGSINSDSRYHHQTQTDQAASRHRTEEETSDEERSRKVETQKGETP
jgi:hypothetical protein